MHSVEYFVAIEKNGVFLCIFLGIFDHIGDLSILVMESEKNKCRIPFV